MNPPQPPPPPPPYPWKYWKTLEKTTEVEMPAVSMVCDCSSASVTLLERCV